MTGSSHKLAIKGEDHTGGAFASIESRAANAAARMHKMLGAAMAGVGTMLGMRSIKSGVDELSRLSDVSQISATSAQEITGLSAALQVLGVQSASVDQLGKMFVNLAKSTGRTGLKGFYDTVEEIGKIKDVSDRSKEAVRIFGQSGAEFMPLINAANEGTGALREVVSAMGGVSQSAAEAGSAAAKGVQIVTNKINNLWYECVAALLKMIHGDVRGGAVALGAYIEYGARVSWRYLREFFAAGSDGVKRYEKVWAAFKDAVIKHVVVLAATCREYIKTIPERLYLGVAGGLYSTLGLVSDYFKERAQEIAEQVGKMSRNMWMSVDQELKMLGLEGNISDAFRDGLEDAFKEVSTDDLQKKLEDALTAAKDFTMNVNNAVGKSSGTNDSSEGGPNDLNETVRRARIRIKNDLIFGGSNASLRLAALGPNLENETKKQTRVLEDIKKELERINEVGVPNAEESFRVM